MPLPGPAVACRGMRLARACMVPTQVRTLVPAGISTLARSVMRPHELLLHSVPLADAYSAATPDAGVKSLYSSTSSKKPRVHVDVEHVMKTSI